MMKPEYCPDYVGIACVDGTCPVANCEEYAERCMPVISSCRNCLDMVLDNEQAKQLADYAVKKEVYNWDGVESVVATALMHENKVVINANW